MTNLVYLDTSALVKLLVDEPESQAFTSYFNQRRAEGTRFITSLLTTIELHRFRVRVLTDHQVYIDPKDIEALLSRISLVDINSKVTESAIGIAHNVESLDAIQLGTALQFDDELSRMITYDQNMLEAAEALGITAHPIS